MATSETTTTKPSVDLLALYRTAIKEQPQKRDPERGIPEHSNVPKKSIAKGAKSRSRLNMFGEKVIDPTLFERAETLMRAKGIRPLAELLKTWGNGDITGVKFLRRSEPIITGQDEPKRTGILDVVKFDYADERYWIYCENSPNLNEVEVDLWVEGNRYVGHSNVTIGRDHRTKSAAVDIGGNGTAIEIQAEEYHAKGLCQIMLIVNLYYYFGLRLLSAGDAELPGLMQVEVSSNYPLSAYKCYAKAAKTFGYFDENGLDFVPPEAAAYQERVLEHSDKPGLRDSFSEAYFNEHFDFVRPRAAPAAPAAPAPSSSNRE